MHWYYTYYLYNIVWLKYTFFLLSYYFLFIFNFDHFYFLLKVFNIYFYLKNKHFFSMKSTESNLEHRKNVAHVDQCQLSRSGTPKENSLRNPNCYLIFVFFREWEPCWLVHVKLELPFVVPPLLASYFNFSGYTASKFQVQTIVKFLWNPKWHTKFITQIKFWISTKK